MNKTYIQKYGIEMVKKNLKYHRRYFKTYGDYAFTGVEVFNASLFRQDIGMNDFPLVIEEINGWKLHKAPTVEEFVSVYEKQSSTGIR